MVKRSIVIYPDERLRVCTQPVRVIDSTILTLIDDMFETMYAAQGVGLAATQIGLDIALAVIDVIGEPIQAENQYVLINPEIVSHGPLSAMQEGCLSVPDVYDSVKRAQTVRFRAQNRAGEWYTCDAEGLLAECVQHEIDHLHGRLFLDLLSPYKKARLRKQFKQQQRSKGKR